MRQHLVPTALALLVPAYAQTPCGSTPLGPVDGADPLPIQSLRSLDLSDDGAVVFRSGPVRVTPALSELATSRWTRSGGEEALGAIGFPNDPFSFDLPLTRLSQDQTTLFSATGETFAAGVNRWRAGTGLEEIIAPGAQAEPGLRSYLLPPDGSFTRGVPGRVVSADGSALVGTAGFTPFAYRWNEVDGLVPIGGQNSGAAAVSADGSVVVGASTVVNGVVAAFRWTEATGIVSLPLPIGTLATGYQATAVSADGSVVFGDIEPEFTFAHSPALALARWPLGGAAETITPVSPGASFSLVGVSEAGDVAIGTADSSNAAGGTIESFRWSESGGYEVIAPGSGLRVTALSADGRFAGGFNAVTGDAVRIELANGAIETVVTASGTAGAAVADLSADGSVVLALDEDGAAFVWTASDVGTRYCSPVANATGCTGRILALGSSSVAENNLTLVGENLPPSTFAMLLGSESAAILGSVPGNPSPLCLGGSIGRFVAPGQIQSTGAFGTFELGVDLAALPTASSIVAAAPGDIWHFQAWHRAASGGASSNFTDAIAIRLE